MASPFAYFFAGVATVAVALGAGFAGSLIALNNSNEKVPASGLANRHATPTSFTARETSGTSKVQIPAELNRTAPVDTPADKIPSPRSSEVAETFQVEGSEVNAEPAAEAPSPTAKFSVATSRMVDEESPQSRKQPTNFEKQRKKEAAAKRKAEARELATERKKRDRDRAFARMNRRLDDEKDVRASVEREPRLRLFGLFGD